MTILVGFGGPFGRPFLDNFGLFWGSDFGADFGTDFRELTGADGWRSGARAEAGWGGASAPGTDSIQTSVICP